MYIKFKPWLEQANDSIPAFVDTLRRPDQIERYFPCINGSTEMGKKISLGFSTFAARIYYMLNRFDDLPEDQRSKWINFLLSFQVEDCRKWGGSANDNSFVDVAEIECLLEMERYKKNELPKDAKVWRLTNFFRNYQRPADIPYSQYTIIAESRQALSTLSLFKQHSKVPYKNFPKTRDGILMYLNFQNWSMPWSAGARTAQLAFFLSTQAPRIHNDAQIVQSLKNTVVEFLDGIVDRETGSYFIGQRPAYAQSVNGAHKVLSALDWLDAPIHFPERLIDTILMELPSPEGCHLVDAVYPLFRCSSQVHYRRKDIKKYCSQLMEMIQKHYNADGGFSYFIGKSQTNYYNIDISVGLLESDLHGSLLLTWALSMLVEIMEINEYGWKSFRP